MNARNTPNMTLTISVVNPKQRIKRSCEEILEDMAQIFAVAQSTKSDLAFLPELYTTGYQMTKSKFIEYALLYEKENLQHRIADLSQRFKMPVLYGYAVYDQNADKIYNCARFYDPNLQLDYIYHRDDYPSQHSIFRRGAKDPPIISWRHRVRLGFGICLDTNKLDDVCGRFHGRCDILFSLSTRSNCIIPQPRFVQSQHMFFMHNYYNDLGSDKCLTVELDLLKLPRYKKIESNLNSASQHVVKFIPKITRVDQTAVKKDIKKGKKRKSQWNF